MDVQLDLPIPMGDMLRTYFSLELGKAMRDRGKSLAALPRLEILDKARALAKAIARARIERTCTADDVQRHLYALGIDSRKLGNAAGSLFLRHEWEPTGLWKASERVSNHGHQNRIWRLKEGI